MNACEKYLELISATIDGEISDADRAALEIHLELCPECRKVAEAFAAISGNFPREAEVPDNFTAGTMAKIKAEAARPTGFKKFISGYGKYTGMAAVLVVVLLGAYAMKGAPKAMDNAAPESMDNGTALYSMTDGAAADMAEAPAYATDEDTSTESDRSGLAAGSSSYGETADSAPADSGIAEPSEASKSAAFYTGSAVTDINALYAKREYTERFYCVSRLYAPAPDVLVQLLESSDAGLLYSDEYEKHYRVPMEPLKAIDPDGIFHEIVFDDLTAEYGLVILMTAEEE